MSALAAAASLLVLLPWVLVEQAAAVDPPRLGELVGHVSRLELEGVNASLRLVLDLD